MGPMDSHELLIRHAREWAKQRSRALDPDVLMEALRLRADHDDASAQTWPVGSAERLMLVLWPAYGSPPVVTATQTTLDTFWRFLRATGRMSSASASPAELRKEAKRAAGKMSDAYDNPTNHSQHRTLADFGTSIGIDLEGAADIDDLTQRMDQLTQAWNDLPVDERVRRMPDPSPKGSVGAEITRDLNAAAGQEQRTPATPEETAQVARAARSAPFVQQCVRLLQWVGEGREVTQAGLLRPAEAREAYQHLDLWPWDRGLENLRMERRDIEIPDRPEADALRARTALTWWRTAGDCLPLDRLWHALEVAKLIEIRTTKARPLRALPDTDKEWATTGLALVLGQAMRMGMTSVEPLVHVLTSAGLGEHSLRRITDRWTQATCLKYGVSDGDILVDIERTWLVEALYVFGDAGLWQVERDRVTLTTMGEFFIDPLLEALDDGAFGDDW